MSESSKNSPKDIKLSSYTGKYHLNDTMAFLWLIAAMPVLIMSVIWGINELMAWMNWK